MITLKHSFDVEADVSTTWEFLQDLTKVAACMPGAHLAAAEGGEYVGGLSARIGPISAKYNGTAPFLEVDEVGHRAVIEAKGREAKGSGSASATITPVLSATTSGTTVDVTTEVNVSGRAAQFGRSLLAEVSNTMFEQFAARLQRAIASGGDEPVASAQAPETGAAGAPENVAAHRSSAATPSPAPDDGSLDVVSTIVLPLVKRYAAPIAAVVAALGATAYLSRRRATTDRRPATDARPIYVVVGAEALASLTGGGPIQE
jgi:carbon monoxide dehydrogenase subunit G